MAAHQASPSLGFSWQEHLSGLPFPSPMHESEKWKWSRSVMSNSSRPHGLPPTRLLRPWGFPGKSTGVGCHCLLRILCYYLLSPKQDSIAHTRNWSKFHVLGAENGGGRELDSSMTGNETEVSIYGQIIVILSSTQDFINLWWGFGNWHLVEKA